MITVDADALDIEISNLELVTANQIRGQITVGTAAQTRWVKPLIYIRGKPVFRAPDPFGVARSGEVLDIELTSIDEGGQWGQFRMMTNLNTAQFNRMKVTPTTSRLDVGNLKPRFPFYVDGVIQIGERVGTGQYGLAVLMGNREIFRKHPLVDVVKPSVGRTGSIEDVTAVEPAHRPGDRVIFVLRGSGFTPRDAGFLSARVTGYDMNPSTITYMSPGRLQILIDLPAQAPSGLYGLAVESKGQVLFEKASVFAIVPANWLNAVKLDGALSPGGRSTLRLTGRDISTAYAGTLTLQVDETALKVSALRQLDPSTLVADIEAADSVSPGDYLIHVYVGSKESKLPGGNLIKVTPK